jgi:septal ring factor EnvC (AmiA/AmiB activator)
MERAKADQVRMARDVANMFDELRALADKHAELHADRARLGGEVEQIRDELERARQDAGLWREEADRERARIATPASPTCRLTPSIPSGRWRGSRRNWSRRGGHGGGGS